MTYASPSHDKFPNRGRWSPARWADRSPLKLSNPPPTADEYIVYADYNDTPDPKDFIGTLKLDKSPDGNSVGVFFYPVLHKLDGYETGENLLDYYGKVVGKKHDYFDPVQLAPRLVAIVTGKTKTKVISRARREALHLSKEPGDLGPRIEASILIDIDAKKIRPAFPAPRMASAGA